MVTRDLDAIVDRHWGLATFAMNDPGPGGQSMTFHLIIIIILAVRNIYRGSILSMVPAITGVY